MTTTGTQGQARPVLLTGHLVRSLLVLTLGEAGLVLTVAELAAGVEGDGFMIRGRPSKDVSDALRWEVRQGRVRRVARGPTSWASFPGRQRGDCVTAWTVTSRHSGPGERDDVPADNLSLRGETAPPS